MTSDVGALSTAHLLTCAYVDLPASNVQSGAHAWVTDGRASGEGVGAGTGVEVYAKNIAGVVTWRRLSDDTVVAV